MPVLQQQDDRSVKPERASMRVWIDLANSPHVATFEPIVRRLEQAGHDVILTARDHAQTLELARRAFPGSEIDVVGGESPAGRLDKGMAIARRAQALRRIARERGAGAALSHGSYSQVVAARSARLPTVTMMDYEYQPANHLSFRLAHRIVVPDAFPAEALRRFGARERKVSRYPGFKEELYLAGFTPRTDVLDELDLDPKGVIVVLRPAPEGALYHRTGNERFERYFEIASSRADLQAVVLPRSKAQEHRYRRHPGIIVPLRPIDGLSLLAFADLMIGAGGTMNREAALLGTPTYTLFAGRLAAVDAELIRLGLLHDLRSDDSRPSFSKKPSPDRTSSLARAEAILSVVDSAIESAVADTT